MPDKPFDLLIDNGLVLTLDDQDRRFNPGAVGISGDSIAWVGPRDAIPRTDSRKTMDARGGIVMPGLINLHTHAAMTLFRGLADDLPLMTWLEEHIFPAEAGLDAERVYWGALLACAEMIRSGTTCFCDMYLYTEAVARAARDSGMRAVVGEVLYDFPSPNYGPIEAGFAYTENLIETWRDDPLVSIAVEPHSPYLCAPDLLTRAAALAGDQGIPMVIHLAETQSEVARIEEKFGCTPVGHLDNLGVLTDYLIAPHCVVLSNGDRDLLASHGTKVAHNPHSNMKLASGVAPIPELLAAGVCVGLGTDGCASNNNLDLFAEMDTAAKLHKVHRLDPIAMDAPATLGMATRQGARALGLNTGSLAVDKRADLIIVDTAQPHLTPMYNPVSHLVYAAGGHDVTTTIVNGRVLMEDRRLTTIDEGEVMARVNEIARQLS